MKKTLLVLAICLVAVTMKVSAQTAKIALQHNGNVTLYASDAMKTVMDAAVDGDTIYLNEGNFISDFSVTKKVSVIGAGQGTKITGNVTVAIAGNPTLSATVLDGLYITGTLTMNAPMDNIKIRKCKFGETTFTANVSNVVFDRCYCYRSFILSTYVKSLTSLNSKIYNLLGSGYTSDAANFINCNIHNIWTNYSPSSGYYNNINAFKGIIMNSIITSYDYNSSSFTYLSPDATLVNCFIFRNSYNRLTSYSVNQNCMSSENISFSGDFMNDLECAISNESLQNNNIIGNDGKVVGIYGGSTPFTLVPSVPTVTSSKIVVDTDNKRLNVDIKVTAN